MTDGYAVQLLRSHLPSHLRGEDGRLLKSVSCKDLGALPLAIKLAVLYMQERQCSLKTDTNLMHQSSDVVEKIHRFKPSGDSSFYEHTVSICWSIWKKKMKDEKKSHALVLLDSMMSLDNQGLPAQTFSKLGDVPESLHEVKALTQPYSLVETMGTLLRCSLLRKDHDCDIISIHPMIHAAIYEAISQSERESAYENATYILWKMFPGPSQSNDDMAIRWKVSNEYFPHLLRNWDRGQESGLDYSHIGATTIRNGGQ